MLHRRFLAIAAVSASVIAGASLVRPATAAQTLDCWMNDSKQTCQVKPWGNGGFEISFSGSAIYRFDLAGAVTAVPVRLEQPADLGYDSKRNCLLVPLFGSDRLHVERL